MKKNWKAIVAVCLVFLFGGIAGGFATTIAIHRRAQRLITGGQPAVTEAIMKRLTRRLGLDATQHKKVEDLVTEAGGKVRDIRKQFRPQIVEVVEDYRGKIRETLTADQQKTFDEMVARNKGLLEQAQK